MRARFISQPFSDDSRIGPVLIAALRERDATSLWVATAWAKQSGVSRIRSVVREFADAGGRSEIVVGIDEGGATREGLELCLELFDDVFIYHDPGTRTFHPKIYVVESHDRAVLIVGSGNLTKGGRFTNYEAAFVLDAARDVEAEWQVRDEMRAYFDRLLAAGSAVRRLDGELVELLAVEGWVTSEARQNARRSAQSRERRERQTLFGEAVADLAGAPPTDVTPVPEEEQDEDSALPLAGPAPAPPLPALAPAGPTVVFEWNKALSRSDAQQPGRRGTNPIGNLRLTEAGNDINHRTFFRQDLFGPATWAPSTDRRSNPIELATVRFDVVIGGRYVGTRNLVVDHAPHRESGQANHLTVLHWGTELRQILRNADYTGHRVWLARMSDGTYRLEIQ